MNSKDDFLDNNPWRDLKNYTWQQHMQNRGRGLRGHKADVVILDDYTENLGDALNAHMADAYKQSALDELFGVV